MYCNWIVNLVNLIMDCNQFTVNYNQRVSKPTVFEVLLEYSEIVIGSVNKNWKRHWQCSERIGTKGILWEVLGVDV